MEKCSKGTELSQQMTKLNIPSFTLCTRKELPPEKLVKLAKLVQE